ncbi:MAG TPA: pyridoxal-phosphate dependent enzyme [Pyrinomonadaceae bacterium]
MFRQVVDRVVTVSEQELVDAMKWMLDHQHVVEPSGAAAVATLLQNPEQLSGRKVAATITGRNISRSRLMALIG